MRHLEASEIPMIWQKNLEGLFSTLIIEWLLKDSVKSAKSRNPNQWTQ